MPPERWSRHARTVSVRLARPAATPAHAVLWSGDVCLVCQAASRRARRTFNGWTVPWGISSGVALMAARTSANAGWPGPANMRTGMVCWPVSSERSRTCRASASMSRIDSFGCDCRRPASTCFNQDTLLPTRPARTSWLIPRRMRYILMRCPTVSTGAAGSLVPLLKALHLLKRRNFSLRCGAFTVPWEGPNLARTATRGMRADHLRQGPGVGSSARWSLVTRLNFRARETSAWRCQSALPSLPCGPLTWSLFSAR